MSTPQPCPERGRALGLTLGSEAGVHVAAAAGASLRVYVVHTVLG